LRVLLDTHALLWAARAPHRLGAQARWLIEQSATERLVSAASCWELGIKFAEGRLPEADALLADWPGLIDRLMAVELAVGSAHALLAPRLEWDHADPFDRILAAQAITEKAALLSLDAAFDSVPELERLW
jgi:PIN domain nuclease of toxin-antitoxin system